MAGFGGLLADQGAATSIPWSPLAAGDLTRPWGQRSTTRAAHNPAADMFGRPLTLDSDQAIVEAVQRVAEARDVPMAHVALAWVLKKSVFAAPIVGATRPHHLTDAAAALSIQLTDDEVRALEEHYTPRSPTWFR
jgi:1-deoxyxylulose-5-phosphate synthase